jgi:hypothetical protein
VIKEIEMFEVLGKKNEAALEKYQVRFMDKDVKHDPDERVDEENPWIFWFFWLLAPLWIWKYV